MSAYDDVRRDKHGTLGDAHARFVRDEDAFTAGVQYALDTMLARTGNIIGVFSPQLPVYLDGEAATILSNVHDGAL